MKGYRKKNGREYWRGLEQQGRTFESRERRGVSSPGGGEPLQMVRVGDPIELGRYTMVVYEAIKGHQVIGTQAQCTCGWRLPTTAGDVNATLIDHCKGHAVEMVEAAFTAAFDPG